eukprot:18440-Heterococcus_DN1.PRE.2
MQPHLHLSDEVSQTVPHLCCSYNIAPTQQHYNLTAHLWVVEGLEVLLEGVTDAKLTALQREGVLINDTCLVLAPLYKGWQDPALQNKPVQFTEPGYRASSQVQFAVVAAAATAAAACKHTDDCSLFSFLFRCDFCTSTSSALSTPAN